MNNGTGDVHTIGQLAKLGNVQMVAVNERQKVIAVTPIYTVVDAWHDEWVENENRQKKRKSTRGNQLFVKTYPELADELIEYIAVDIALLFTGVGAAIRLGGKVVYRVAGEVANVVLMGNQTLEDVTAFLGYNENQGYNVLLDSMRYLDSQTGNTKAFEASYHAANMFMLFGKNVKTKTLTGVMSASGGASITYIESFVGQEKVLMPTPNTLSGSGK